MPPFDLVGDSGTSLILAEDVKQDFPLRLYVYGGRAT